MYKTIQALSFTSGLLFFLFFGASIAFAQSIPTIIIPSDATTTPQSQFTFFCDPYSSSFVDGGSYVLNSNTTCTYGFPQLSGGNVFFGVYSGVPGTSTLLSYDATSSPYTVLEVYPFNFVGSQGENFYTVAIGYSGAPTDLSEVSLDDDYFEHGQGFPPLPYSIIQWQWGVTPIGITVTANNQTIELGSSLPSVFTATLSGFAGSDTAAEFITGSPSCTTTATSASPAGTYPITCTVGTLEASGYYFISVFVPGTLTIQAPPTETPPAGACQMPAVVPAGYTLITATTNATVTLAPQTMFVGGNSNDTITGGNGSYIVCTGEGNSTITLGNGNDTIQTGAGNNTIATGVGNQTITTGAGNQNIHTGNGNSTIVTGAGNQNIRVGNGNNLIMTGAGNSALITGTGNQIITAGIGNNTIKTGTGSDTITIEGNGNNSVVAGGESSTCTVGSGNNTVTGCQL